MGKKKGIMGKRKAAEIDEEENDADPELEAEMQALAAIRAEKAGRGGENSSEGNEDALSGNEEEDYEEASDDSNSEADKEEEKDQRKRPRGQFHKEALSAALESMRTNDLSFVEKMEICEFEIGPIDENDDLQRETEFLQPNCFGSRRCSWDAQSGKCAPTGDQPTTSPSLLSLTHIWARLRSV